VKPDKQKNDRTWLMSLLTQAQLKAFYGELTIIMEAGKVKRIVKKQSLLPPD